jgi:hypothetical protein
VLRELAETPELLMIAPNGAMYGAGHVFLGGDATCLPENCILH